MRPIFLYDKIEKELMAGGFSKRKVEERCSL